jgi:hypothetical protein
MAGTPCARRGSSGAQDALGLERVETETCKLLIGFHKVLNMLDLNAVCNTYNSGIDKRW